MNSIYIISTFTKCEISSNGCLNFGDIRSVCWRKTYQEALDVVLNNVCDIFESYYGYVVIEKISSCLYPTTDVSYEKTFLKWNLEKEQYEQTNEVKQLIEGTHISPVFSIG